jgi:LysR family transcriptional regulator, glycine cleavage system transcriptional activator
MWQDMPPLAALRAFSAFAQSGSVVQAGAALNVSHAAISQQLRGLERHMGLALLDRTGRAMALTDDGTRLANALELGFGAIAATVQELTGADEERPLHVSLTPTFASSWLMPRLTGFQTLYPDINLMLDPSSTLVSLDPGGIDLAIRYGHGDWPGLTCEPLLISPMVIIAAPSLIAGRVIRTPADLASMTWLEELGTTEASNWLQSRGVEQGRVKRRIQVPGNLLLDGARDGQGVTVVVRDFAEPDLKAGRLVELFSEDSDNGYHIVTRPGVLRPVAKTFVQWLRRQKAM